MILIALSALYMFKLVFGFAVDHYAGPKAQQHGDLGQASTEGMKVSRHARAPLELERFSFGAAPEDADRQSHQLR